jgi:RNA polymerase sigma-70 factor, ECF subfamily
MSRRRRFLAAPEHLSAELLRRWQDEGDVGALDEILRIEVGILKGLILARGRDLVVGSAGASDIAQEAVLRLLQLEKAPRFSDPDELQRYLWVTAWRLMLQRVRGPYRRKTRLDLTASSQLPPELVAQPGSDAEKDETVAALDLAMNLLPEGDREMLHRVYFVGEKIAQVARGLGMSESAVKMRLLRARRTLAERLAAWRKVIG